MAWWPKPKWFVQAAPAERDTAIEMLSEGSRHPSQGADKAYDTRGFIEQARGLHVTPHVAQNLARRGGSAKTGADLRQRDRYRRCIYFSFQRLSPNSIAMYNTPSAALSLLCRVTRFIFALLSMG